MYNIYPASNTAARFLGTKSEALASKEFKNTSSPRLRALSQIGSVATALQSEGRLLRGYRIAPKISY